jgi:hypothetical protein
LFSCSCSCISSANIGPAERRAQRLPHRNDSILSRCGRILTDVDLDTVSNVEPAPAENDVPVVRDRLVGSRAERRRQ